MFYFLGRNPRGAPFNFFIKFQEKSGGATPISGKLEGVTLDLGICEFVDLWTCGIS